MSTVFEDRVLVEIYQTEAAEFDTDDAEAKECQELAEKLGLSGQKNIFKSDGVIPFPKLSKAEKNIWNAFCPSVCDVSDYEDTVIPARVMKIIEYCTDKQYFGTIEIWSESETNPDPIVVGIIGGSSKYNGNVSCYLIARWGEALASWQEVVKIAREKWIRSSTNELTSAIAHKQEKLNSLEHQADIYFAGGTVFI